MINFIDKIEKRFKDRPLSTRVVGAIIAYIVLEILKLIYSFLTGGSLKPIFLWLIETKVTISVGLLVLILLLLLLAFYAYQLRLKRRTTSYTLTSQQDKNKFKLIKQIPADDHFYESILRLNDYYYEISFKPNASTDYWRFGIKFSHGHTIHNIRYTKGNPVFHLTKWIETKWVAATYYDENNRLWTEKDKIIIDEYNKERISFKLYNINNKTLVVISNENNRELYIHEIEKYEYAKIFAWGDKYNFEFDCELIETRKK